MARTPSAVTLRIFSNWFVPMAVIAVSRSLSGAAKSNKSVNALWIVALSPISVLKAPDMSYIGLFVMLAPKVESCEGKIGDTLRLLPCSYGRAELFVRRLMPVEREFERDKFLRDYEREFEPLDRLAPPFKVLTCLPSLTKI